MALIFLILWWTYRDLAGALVMILTIPGAIAGGVFFQWLFGFKFSVTVWVGSIACFGMATADEVIDLLLPVAFDWVRARRPERLVENLRHPGRNASTAVPAFPLESPLPAGSPDPAQDATHF